MSRKTCRDVFFTRVDIIREGHVSDNDVKMTFGQNIDAQNYILTTNLMHENANDLPREYTDEVCVRWLCRQLNFADQVKYSIKGQ